MEIVVPIPQALSSTSTSITVSWSDTKISLFELPDGCSRMQYILQMKDRIKGWNPVYWGFNTEFEVTGLDSEQCYQFRLKVSSSKEESQWSPVLLATTKEDQFPAMNLYTSIQYGVPRSPKMIFPSRYDSVETFNSMGISPLMQATAHGDLQMVSLLLSAGADVNARSSASGRTVLMIACYKGEREIARRLREKGADYDISDRGGCTALHYAVDGSQMETMQQALNEGADIEAKDNEERTPLMRGVVLQSSFLILQKLLERGAITDAVDRHGQTCLMQAVLSGRQDVVKLLVEAGADLSSYNMYHNTALDMARARDLKGILPLLTPKSAGVQDVKKWKRIAGDEM